MAWRSGKISCGHYGEILKDLEFPKQDVDIVSRLILQKGAATDPERQVLEDLACLAFIEFDLVAFARTQTPDKLGDILRRTWGKMSSSAQELARSDAIPADARRLVETP